MSSLYRGSGGGGGDVGVRGQDVKVEERVAQGIGFVISDAPVEMESGWI